jgi:hypothetical protein
MGLAKNRASPKFQDWKSLIFEIASEKVCYRYIPMFVG